MGDNSMFGERLAYAMYLAGDVSQESVGDAVGRTQPAVRAWLDRVEPPTNYLLHDPLAAFLKVPKGWLIDGTGAAPRPDIWKSWLVTYRHKRALVAQQAKRRSG